MFGCCCTVVFPKSNRNGTVYIRSHTNVDYPPSRDPPETKKLGGEGRVENEQAE